MINLEALKAELTNDPVGIGYTDGGGGDIGNKVDAGMLNSTTTGRVTSRDTVHTYELLAVADRNELMMLAAADLEMFKMLLMVGEVPVNDPGILAIVLDLFSPGTTTRTNFAELRTKPTSRSDELFGEGMAYWDVAKARALP